VLKPRDRETLRKYLLSEQKNKKLNPQLIDFFSENYSDFVFINNGKVSLSKGQKLNLKSKIFDEYGHNFLQPIDATDDRIDTAAKHNDEKDARVKPEQNYLIATQQSGVIVAAGFTATLPQGVSARVNIKSLDLQLIDSIIVVENLAVFDHWYLASIPNQLSTTLTVYRGHDETAKSVQQLLKRCANSTNIIACMDYDPKGLNLALTLPGVTHILVPDLAHADPTMNRPDLFVKQADYLWQLKHNPKWNQYPFIRDLTGNGNHLAFAQETILARNVPLKCVAL